MRIGIVTGEYPPMQGGVGAYTQILARALSQQGQTISVLTNVQGQDKDPTIKLKNNIVKWNFGTLNTIHDWAKYEQLEVINLQFQTAAYNMSPWIHFLPDVISGVPVVTTFHDLRFPYLFPKAGGLRKRIVKHLAEVSDAIIATNHEDFEQLNYVSHKTLIPIGSNILKTVPLNFESNIWRAKAGAQADDFLIAYFGLFNHTKGLETLLTSFHNLHKSGIPARLIFVGGGAGSSDPSNATFINQMNQQIEQLKLNEYICRTGYLENDAEVGAYLTASDVVALPFLDGASYRRGSLMAAIHYGCPIVTTQPQTPISTFKDGENMRLVKSGDSVALTSALRELHESPELRKHLQHGAAKLANEFEWLHIAQAHIQFFQQVAS
ncbi:MAG: glycosyltransferase [Anaerolineae bacterium]|nr:glycosyltransferase [Anaerolineae bacterium]